MKINFKEPKIPFPANELEILPIKALINLTPSFPIIAFIIGIISLNAPSNKPTDVNTVPHVTFVNSHSPLIAFENPSHSIKVSLI